MIRPTITAHSGCEGTASGSMAAIVTGIELGADIVEVDVRRVPGLGFVLSHDAVSGPAGLVTLEAAFAQLKKHPGVGINCDLKVYGLAEDVLALADDCALAKGQLAFSGSLRPSELRANPAIARRAGVYLNIEEALAELYRARHPEAAPADEHAWDTVRGRVMEDFESWIEPLVDLCSSLPIRALNLPPQPFGPWLQRLGEAGARCSVWTIDESEAMRGFMAAPYIINLTTRRARLALDIRQAMRGKDRWS
ncbi:hypothetical protein ACH6CV_06820 [Bacillota bacterium Meth-B3]